VAEDAEGREEMDPDQRDWYGCGFAAREITQVPERPSEVKRAEPSGIEGISRLFLSSKMLFASRNLKAGLNLAQSALSPESKRHNFLSVFLF